MLFFNIVQRIVQVWEMLIQKPQYKYLRQYFLSLDSADILFFISLSLPFLFRSTSLHAQEYAHVTAKIVIVHYTIFLLLQSAIATLTFNCCINYSFASVV